MDQLRRGNYDSGQDYVLEYGELRFTFNERDFSERVEQAALKLAFVKGRLHEAELEDLVNLTVNGEVQDPASALGQRVKEGELDITFDDRTHTFGYVQPDRDAEPIELSPEPNWHRVAYSPR